MRKYRFVFLCICTVAVFACTDNKKNPSVNEKKDVTVKSSAKNFIGTYSTTENNLPMQFVLTADGKGYENYQGREKRPFAWKMKDEKIFFVYDGETNEFELPIDFTKNEIQYGALVYKKE